MILGKDMTINIYGNINENIYIGKVLKSHEI